MSKEKIVIRKNAGSLLSHKLPGVNVDHETYQQIYKIAQFMNASQSEAIRVLLTEALKFVEMSEEVEV